MITQLKTEPKSFRAGLFGNIAFKYSVRYASLPEAVCQNLTFDVYTLVMDSGDVPLTLGLDWSYKGVTIGSNNGIGSISARVRLFFNVSFKNPDDTIVQISVPHLHVLIDPEYFGFTALYLPQLFAPTIARAIETQGAWVIQEMIKSCLHKPGLLGREHPCPPNVNSLWLLSWNRPGLRFVSPGWAFFSGVDLLSFILILLCIGACCRCCSCCTFFKSRADRLLKRAEVAVGGAEPLAGNEAQAREHNSGLGAPLLVE